MKLLRIETTLMCASMMDAPKFFEISNSNVTIRISQQAVFNMVGNCTKYVDGMIELGEAYTEVEIQLFIVSRYAKGKLSGSSGRR